MATEKQDAKQEAPKAKQAKQAKGGGKGQKGKGAGKTEEFKVYKRETPPRLKQKYMDEVRSKLMDEFKYKSSMQTPRLVKITINMGLGAANQNPKMIESAVEELRAIAGQAPVVCLAKKDIATFKLRKGQKIGCMVTLRSNTMWEFLDRLINIALPRVRDFKGVSEKAFDGRGNYTLGVKEQIVFPEIDYDNIDSVKGMNISIVTTAATDAEGRALLTHLGMPFRQTAAGASAHEGARA